MIRRIRCFIFFLAFPAFFLPLCSTAEEPESSAGVIEEIRDTIDNLRTLEEGRVGFEKWSGMNAKFGFAGLSLFEGVDTILWYTFGFDIDSAGYFRRPDGSLYTGSDPEIDPYNDPYYVSLRPQLSLGLTQGLVPGTEEERDDLLEWYFFTRFHEELYFYRSGGKENNLLYRSGLPENEGTALIYFISGFNLDTVQRLPVSRTYEGIAVDIGVSGVPASVSAAVAESNYSYAGIHADIRGFIPYIEIFSDGGFNLLSIYQGWWLRGDYVFGPSIPVQVLQNITGRFWEEGLGGAVRGLETNRFSAPLKIVASTDLRFNLPAIGLPSLLPGVVVFFDAGYYRYFEEVINGDEAGITLSAGGGLFIDLFGMFELVFQATVLLNDTLLDGTRFTPFDFEFNLHF